MIQIVKIQNSYLSIFLNITRIVYIFVKFTVHIVYLNSHGVKIVIGQFQGRLNPWGRRWTGLAAPERRSESEGPTRAHLSPKSVRNT